MELKKKECKYFDKGAGECPFGNMCFYRHEDKNGKIVDVGPPSAQTMNRPRLTRGAPSADDPAAAALNEEPTDTTAGTTNESPAERTAEATIEEPSDMFCFALHSHWLEPCAQGMCVSNQACGGGLCVWAAVALQLLLLHLLVRISFRISARTFFFEFIGK